MVEHLKREAIIKQGSFYTPNKIVNLVYQLIKKNQIQFDYICDTSAGYGDFILSENKDRFIYIDNDEQALAKTKRRYGTIFNYLCKNSLQNLQRKDLGIKAKDKLLIIGNPPYNDRTSFYKKHKKGKARVYSVFNSFFNFFQSAYQKDKVLGQELLRLFDTSFYKEYQKQESPIVEDLWDRDLGISFFKSFVKLKAEYVCILHPLSYLIKRTKFNSLKTFKNEYTLIDGLVISSKHFAFTSQKTQFPILIGIYQRHPKGMTFEQIKSFRFPIYRKKYTFSVDQFCYIEDLHTKYKNRQVVQPYDHFYTLRDMNQLTINTDWLKAETSNSIRVQSINKKIFDFLSKLKKWFTKNQNRYYFLGNLSPIIFPNWLKTKEVASLTDLQFTRRFNQELTKSKPPWYPHKDKKHLVWSFTNVAAGSKYRFKLRDPFTSYGDTVASASYPVTDQCFLEIQVAYDKPLKDFFQKPSWKKVNFINGKTEQRFFFELSDILCWIVKNNWVDRSVLKAELRKINYQKDLLEKDFPISCRQPTFISANGKPSLFNQFSFIQSDINKPRLICHCVEGNFVEIQIEKRQKAVGSQAMLYYNISAQNLTKNNLPVVGQLIKKADYLEYAIKKEMVPKIFVKLATIFLYLSQRHQQDMKAIIEKILAFKD